MKYIIIFLILITGCSHVHRYPCSVNTITSEYDLEDCWEDTIYWWEETR